MYGDVKVRQYYVPALLPCGIYVDNRGWGSDEILELTSH